MALTYSSVNIEQPPQQGGGAGLPPFSATFTIASWLLESGEYIINIAQATHGRGNDLVIQVYEFDGVDYQLVDIATEHTSIGDVVIRTNEIPETRFNGRIVISGE